jgi:hypothetical protein
MCTVIGALKYSNSIPEHIHAGLTLVLPSELIDTTTSKSQCPTCAPTHSPLRLSCPAYLAFLWPLKMQTPPPQRARYHRRSTAPIPSGHISYFSRSQELDRSPSAFFPSAFSGPIDDGPSMDNPVMGNKSNAGGVTGHVGSALVHGGTFFGK